MIKLFKIAILSMPVVAGCGVIYTPQDLPSAGVERVGAQESIDLTIVALTNEIAARANRTPFDRSVVMGNDLSGPARLLDEAAALRVRPPSSSGAPAYRIGVGDVLAFSRLMPEVTNSGNVNEEYRTRPLVVTSSGHITILEVGRVDVAGLTVPEAEEAISRALLRGGVDPRFELAVSDFNSQKVFLSGDLAGRGAIPYTDRPVTLAELLSTSGLALTGPENKLIKLFRNDVEYRLSARELLTSVARQDYYVYPGDRIYVENINYRPETVIIAGEVGAQRLFPISAEARPTLADALYSSNALASFTSDSGQIYLIRTGDETIAYHLDASNPARLAVATRLELRPRDIVFVSEQPVTRYNRVLQQLLGALGGTTTLRTELQGLAAE